MEPVRPLNAILRSVFTMNQIVLMAVTQKCPVGVTGVVDVNLRFSPKCLICAHVHLLFSVPSMTPSQDNFLNPLGLWRKSVKEGIGVVSGSATVWRRICCTS